MDNSLWNLEQLDKVVTELNEMMARFYLNQFGNEVVNILINCQEQLQSLSDYAHEQVNED